MTKSELKTQLGLFAKYFNRQHGYQCGERVIQEYLGGIDDEDLNEEKEKINPKEFFEPETDKMVNKEITILSESFINFMYTYDPKLFKKIPDLDRWDRQNIDFKDNWILSKNLLTDFDLALGNKIVFYKTIYIEGENFEITYCYMIENHDDMMVNLKLIHKMVGLKNENIQHKA